MCHGISNPSVNWEGGDILHLCKRIFHLGATDSVCEGSIDSFPGLAGAFGLVVAVPLLLDFDEIHFIAVGIFEIGQLDLFVINNRA